jgi:hypothetical protein
MIRGGVYLQTQSTYSTEQKQWDSGSNGSPVSFVVETLFDRDLTRSSIIFRACTSFEDGLYLKLAIHPGSTSHVACVGRFRWWVDKSDQVLYCSALSRRKTPFMCLKVTAYQMLGRMCWTPILLARALIANRPGSLFQWKWWWLVITGY